MSTYALESHTLQFSSDYASLLVKSGSTTVATLDLTQNVPPYRVQVVDGNYDISQTTCEGCTEIAALDVANGVSTASFDGARLDGIGLMDLRDTGKHHTKFHFDLNCGPVSLRKVTGAYSLKFFAVIDSGCYTSEA